MIHTSAAIAAAVSALGAHAAKVEAKEQYRRLDQLYGFNFRKATNPFAPQEHQEPGHFIKCAYCAGKNKVKALNCHSCAAPLPVEEAHE